MITKAQASSAIDLELRVGHLTEEQAADLFVQLWQMPSESLLDALPSTAQSTLVVKVLQRVKGARGSKAGGG